MSAKISDSATPARMPQIAPTMIDADRNAPPNPQAAPTIIMPSTPRLSTPARSVTSSPVAAINSGVDAARTARMMASSRPTGHLSGRENQPEAIENQGIAGEHVEQQDALKNLCQVQRYFQGNLRPPPADEGQRQEKPGDKNSDRVQAAEKGNDDRRKPVARRNVGLEVADRACDLDDAGETRERPLYYIAEEANSSVMVPSAERRNVVRESR